MVALDTSIVIDKITKREEVGENITIVTLIEYPKISGHSLFKGKVYLPTEQDYVTAFKLQRELYKGGKPKSFADLIIAAICINRGEKLITKDNDFRDIAEVSELNVEITEEP